jgi:hypothetical protein
MSAEHTSWHWRPFRLEVRRLLSLAGTLALILVIGSNSAPAQPAPSAATTEVERDDPIRNHMLLPPGEMRNPGQTSAAEFSRLHDERQWAVFELDHLRANIEHYRATAAPKPEIVETLDRQSYDAELQKLNDQIKDADAKVKESSSEDEIQKARSDLLSYSKKRENLLAAWSSSEKYNADVTSWKQDYDSNLRNIADADRLLAYIGSLDGAINHLLLATNVDNKFKTDISLTFAVLVGLVIVGFFAVALKEESIRKTIFANDSGLQFVTLFSLVIAIILFGVINILEGKELAALLGGLSGYILGRGANLHRTSPENEQPPKPSGEQQAPAS